MVVCLLFLLIVVIFIYDFLSHFRLYNDDDGHENDCRNFSQPNRGPRHSGHYRYTMPATVTPHNLIEGFFLLVVLRTD